MSDRQAMDDVPRYADMLSAMGTEPRLRIMRLLLSAHPEGMVVGDIGSELEIANSTLSHHLDKLKNEDLVKVRREGTFLGGWTDGALAFEHIQPSEGVRNTIERAAAGPRQVDLDELGNALDALDHAGGEGGEQQLSGIEGIGTPGGISIQLDLGAPADGDAAVGVDAFGADIVFEDRLVRRRSGERVLAIARLRTRRM